MKFHSLAVLILASTGATSSWALQGGNPLDHSTRRLAPQGTRSNTQTHMAAHGSGDRCEANEGGMDVYLTQYRKMVGGTDNSKSGHEEDTNLGASKDNNHKAKSPASKVASSEADVLYTGMASYDDQYRQICGVHDSRSRKVPRARPMNKSLATPEKVRAPSVEEVEDPYITQYRQLAGSSTARPSIASRKIANAQRPGNTKNEAPSWNQRLPQSRVPKDGNASQTPSHGGNSNTSVGDSLVEGFNKITSNEESNGDRLVEQYQKLSESFRKWADAETGGKASQIIDEFRRREAEPKKEGNEELDRQGGMQMSAPAPPSTLANFMPGSESKGNLFANGLNFEDMGIGGLDEEFKQIFRRAFVSRMWPPHVVRQMGIKHVRGMLLYGPPGCGKTLIARQIAKALNAREPKIINGPEILNKFIGGSEENVRELFVDAEKEYARMGDESKLHIIIIDEMDSICRERGSVNDMSGVADSVVNQLLGKMDGVDSLNNVLLIGMTNRKDKIDDALLRPGRMEVHVEIKLPNEEARQQILEIHTKEMRKYGRISQEATDRLPELAKSCENFSGAELEGLVKAASSFALTRCVDLSDLSKSPDISELMVEYSDLENAMKDIEPRMGRKIQTLKPLFRKGLIPYNDSFNALMGSLESLVDQVRSSPSTALMSVLLQGHANAGKTAIAAKIASETDFPFVRLISADEMIGMPDVEKCQHIRSVFMDAYNSPKSVILLDEIERIIDYVPTGPYFSNAVLQTLLIKLKKVPVEEDRQLMVIGTTSCPHLLEDLGLTQAFGVAKTVPMLCSTESISKVLQSATDMPVKEAEIVARDMKKPIGIKQLLRVAEMANGSFDDLKNFETCLELVGHH